MILVVAGLIQRGDQWLVAERPPGKSYTGYWEFPGGKIEREETAEMALKRELNEELGISVSLAHHWFDHIHHYPDKTVKLELWRVSDYSGEPYGREHQRIAWKTVNEMRAMTLLVGNLAIVDKMEMK